MVLLATLRHRTFGLLSNLPLPPNLPFGLKFWFWFMPYLLLPLLVKFWPLGQNVPLFWFLLLSLIFCAPWPQFPNDPPPWKLLPLLLGGVITGLNFCTLALESKLAVCILNFSSPISAFNLPISLIHDVSVQAFTHRKSMHSHS